MGTFDSVYKNKIRQLEEENQQLRNILNEYFAAGGQRKFVVTPEQKQRINDTVKRLGDDGPPRTEEQKQKTRESQMKFYREIKKRGDLGYEPSQPILDRKPEAPKSEPAPYASDDMESRRVQPGYGGADGPEGMKDQFGRSRDHHNYGRPPLMPQGGFGRPLTPGMGGIYR